MRSRVELAKAYRLLNHGPTVLVSAAHAGLRNVMAAAWTMPLDFDPPKLAVVIDKSTFTRGLVEGSGHFALSVPPRAMADLTHTLGSSSGRELREQELRDKFEAYGLEALAGERVDAPLIGGCIAWLECRLLPEASIQERYDLFLGEVLAASADDRVFREGRWCFGPDDGALRSIHHVAGGHFLVDGDPLDARRIEALPLQR